MFRPFSMRALAYAMTLHLVLLGFVPAAQAGIVDTQASILLEQREARLDRINSALAREDVQREMLTLGVTPDQVEERLATLTDQELNRIEGKLDELPAGGNVAAVIGVLFVILIILELLGVTNVFTKL